MSTITKQAVQAVADLKVGYTLGHADVAMLNELARIALASLEAEAVAYIIQDAQARGLGRPGFLSFDASISDEDINEYEISVTPLYTAPQLPQPAMPDEDLLHMAASAIDDLLSNKDRSGAGVWADIPAKLRRAAMLQGAEPVTTANKLLDGWVACSERMPEDDDFVYIWPRPDFGVELHVGQYCECHPKGDGWYAQVCEQNYGIEWCPITVTHWMPLPAAPQQEA